MLTLRSISHHTVISSPSGKMIKKTCHLSPSRITAVMLHFTLRHSDNFFSHYPCLFNALNNIAFFLIFSVSSSLPRKEGKPIIKFLHQPLHFWMQSVFLSAFPPKRLQELKRKALTLAGSAHLLPVSQGASHRRMVFLFDNLTSIFYFVSPTSQSSLFSLARENQ